jgi:hypothetical protein
MMRRAFLVSIALLTGTPALASDLNVTMDEVRTIVFPEPVATVYVGNPTIADINMIDARHAFVLGKAFGTTNIVALNHSGMQIANDRVTVFSPDTSIVTLNLGASRVTYNCAADRCEPAPMPGDAKDIFDQAVDQINKHEDLSKKAATGP